MATVTTAAHGVRLVTEIIPLNLETTRAPASSGCEHGGGAHRETKPDVPNLSRLFLKGQPIALGTVQVFIGLVMVALGTVNIVTATLQGEVPLALGILCVICGSVTLATYKGTCVRRIKSTLVLNLIGALLALAAILYFCVKLAIKPDPSGCAGNYKDNVWDCKIMTQRFNDLMNGLKSVLLILSVLMGCVCTTLVVSSKASLSGHSN
ncbi:uncharacterized protein LOC143487687 [Brachyhypopomus gauderio]|uniref:uncharacterized protein LOC143487687 n=1 Tax=Brachyhypopomus gauderio TaxID=698409 RepID=UPI004041D923